MGRKVQSNENISYGNDNMFVLQLQYLAQRIQEAELRFNSDKQQIYFWIRLSHAIFETYLY